MRLRSPSFIFICVEALDADAIHQAVKSALAEDIGVIWVLLGLVAFAISIALFLKCKPLEQKED